MQDDPPTYADAMISLQARGDDNTVEENGMIVDSRNPEEISAQGPILVHLPMLLEVGKVETFFTENASVEEAKYDVPLSVVEGHPMETWAHLSKRMDEATANQIGYARIANHFLHPPFQSHCLMLNKLKYPDLENLHALRTHSMKHILERCLQKWSKPEEVIMELLGRVFGVMCMSWDLLSKENSLLLQVNSQAAGLLVMEERMNKVHNELQSNLFQAGSNLVKAENISTLLGKLDLLGSNVDQLNEITAVKENVTKVAKDVGILVSERQEDAVRYLEHHLEKQTQEKKLSDKVEELEKYKEKYKEVRQINVTLSDAMIGLRTENNLAQILHAEQKNTIDALQGAVTAKDVTIAALQELLRVTTAQQGQHSQAVF